MPDREFSTFQAELEIRQRGSGRVLSGRFPYSQGPGSGLATLSNRGKRRKERVGRNAFRYQLDEFDRLQAERARTTDPARLEEIDQALERRNTHVLIGHDYNLVMGDRLRGTARIASNDDALTFEVDLPDEVDMPTYMLDGVRMVRAGLLGGLSPGFSMPPPGTRGVGRAESFELEPGTGVEIRVVEDAILYEISLVSRPAFHHTSMDVRAEEEEETEKPVTTDKRLLCL